MALCIAFIGLEYDVITIHQLVFCCGKVYYDLLARRRDAGIKHIALVRVEQLYPLPSKEIVRTLAKYPGVKHVVWCQEEPKNQGAWYALRGWLEACLAKDQSLRYVGRSPYAAPAAGYPKLNQQQQLQLVEEALGLTQRPEEVSS